MRADTVTKVQLQTHNGSVLPAVLVMLTASMVLTTGALRSATTGTSLSGTLTFAHDAFWLAETGISQSMEFARNHAPSLPASGSITLPPQQDDTGHYETAIHATGSDTACPTLAPLPATRFRFEIHATGYAGGNAISRHIQGFFICSSICAEPECLAVETEPEKTYWAVVDTP